jgi:Fe-S cluster biogenesis protein NfuA
MLLESPERAAPPAILNGQRETEPGPRDELKQQGLHIQQLMEQSQRLADPSARELVQDCIQTLLAFQGRGLGQILEVVLNAGPEGEMVMDRLLANDAVRALLLIHGLHPMDLPSRLQQALDQVRPYMESHGGNVELLSLENDVARLRLQGTCKTCPSSTVTMELAVRKAIEEFCPDLAGFEVEGTNGAAVAGNGDGHPKKPEGES